MKRSGRLAIFALLANSILILCAACSPALSVTVKPDLSGTATFTAALSPTADSVVRRFSKTETNAKPTATTPLFDKNKIIVSLAHAGIKTDSVEFPSSSSLNLGVSFPKLDGLLDKAVVLESGKRKLTVTISRLSVLAALALMPPETANYTDLFMAPVFTGEEMDQNEYEATIGAAYGKTLAGELKQSIFTLTVHCPSPVTAAKINAPASATASGSTAVFKIPLSTLLVLGPSLIASAEW
jgi:hypothetical protein